MCPGWPPAAPPGAGAPAPPRTACAMTASTTSGRRVSVALEPGNKMSLLFFISAQKLLPEQLPLEDDNSDFTLQGYQNFLIEPMVHKIDSMNDFSKCGLFHRSVVMTEIC